jgi:hypothetical protein
VNNDSADRDFAMNLEDLEHLLLMHEAQKEVYGALDNFAASLVIVRSEPPTGYKIKVPPFGNCTILNVQAKPEGIQTCFVVTKKQLIKAVEAIKKDMAA